MLGENVKYCFGRQERKKCQNFIKTLKPIEYKTHNCASIQWGGQWTTESMFHELLSLFIKQFIEVGGGEGRSSSRLQRAPTPKFVQIPLNYSLFPLQYKEHKA